MSLKISRLLIRLYSALVIFQISNVVSSAAQETSHEPMGKQGAPLGTVWVRELESKLKEYHLSMAQKELHDSSGAGIQKNIAMFGLNLVKQDGTMFPILEKTSKNFLSGGFMLIDPDNQKLEDVPAKRKRCEDDISKKEKVLRDARSELTKFAGTAGSNQSGVDEACSQIKILLQKIRNCEADEANAKSSISQLKNNEDAYAPPIFKDKSIYTDHTNAIYDPEQTIARIVDHHITQAALNEEEITINSQSFKKTEVDSIVLNLHTRTDMCPFCSMFLAQKLSEWQQKMANISIIVLVTSRQEYRCDYPFIKQQTYYKGYSMRSFARRPGDDGSSFDGLKIIAADGLVIQYAFLPEEIYSQETVNPSSS
jgi:hypothetical protein